MVDCPFRRNRLNGTILRMCISDGLLYTPYIETGGVRISVRYYSFSKLTQEATKLKKIDPLSQFSKCPMLRYSAPLRIGCGLVRILRMLCATLRNSHSHEDRPVHGYSDNGK